MRCCSANLSINEIAAWRIVTAIMDERRETLRCLNFPLMIERFDQRSRGGHGPPRKEGGCHPSFLKVIGAMFVGENVPKEFSVGGEEGVYSAEEWCRVVFHAFEPGGWEEGFRKSKRNTTKRWNPRRQVTTPLHHSFTHISILKTRSSSHTPSKTLAAYSSSSHPQSPSNSPPRTPPPSPSSQYTLSDWSNWKWP